MFCKIYTTGDITNEESLLRILSNKLNTTITDGYISSRDYTIYVDINEEYCDDKQKRFPDGFLYFRYLIEVNFQDSTKKDLCLSITNNILSSLWHLKYPAVASCNYEQELLFKGGFNNTELPWVL